MYEDNHTKNFSEPKNRITNKHCRFCKEPVPRIALAFSNTVAIEQGYCCWICILGDLGPEKGYRILEKKAKENQGERKQHF